VADETVERNLQRMDELDFAGWNEADWGASSPVTTLTKFSWMSTGRLRRVAFVSTSRQ
jgi:hypothetical protein